MTASFLPEQEEDAGRCALFFERFIDAPPDHRKGWIQWTFSNRWLRLVAYGIVTMSCCAIYFGWQQFQKILFQGGTYAWLCTEQDPNWSYEVNGACAAQNAKAQMLYTIASAMEYVVGVSDKNMIFPFLTSHLQAAAGVALDHLGPRLCGLTGLAVLFLGVVLLIFASQSFQVYIVSMILLGGSVRLQFLSRRESLYSLVSQVNLIAFPAVLAGDFFPSHQALVIAFIVACQIGCAAIAIVLLEIWRANPSLSMHHLFWGYLGVVWLPCCVLYFFFLPCRRRVLRSSPTDLPRSSTDASDRNVLGDGDCEQATGLSKRRTKSNHHEKIEQEAEQTVVLNGDWRSFFKELLTWDVEIFGMYYVSQLLQFVYYPTTTLQMFGQWMSDFAGNSPSVVNYAPLVSFQVTSCPLKLFGEFFPGTWWIVWGRCRYATP
ncbi:arginine transporter 1-like [Condylostylus longicornis]|uniref:arginine transporter 1-like n=1 Tax=Condylostylus longicornis TaxID=2530218 RepID=UPI00244E21B7|nr:arginine transporter 1-like [Condylostylus longicornis]